MSKIEHRYSYSGADVDVYAMINNRPQTAVQLEAMHTVSVSIHESKGQARALGYKGIKGISRGVATYAGSFIMTVIEDHPLAPLMRLSSQYRTGGWSVDRDLNGVGTMWDVHRSSNMLSTRLEPFDIMLRYVSEGDQFHRSGVGAEAVLDYRGAGLLISNIDIIDSGLVTSVNDIVTEMTFTFIAQDVKTLSLNELESRLSGEPADAGVHGIDIHSMHGELERYLLEGMEIPHRDKGIG